MYGLYCSCIIMIIIKVFNMYYVPMQIFESYYYYNPDKIF